LKPLLTALLPKHGLSQIDARLGNRHIMPILSINDYVVGGAKSYAELMPEAIGIYLKLIAKKMGRKNGAEMR
jgi:hypothetical protein